LQQAGPAASAFCILNSPTATAAANPKTAFAAFSRKRRRETPVESFSKVSRVLSAISQSPYKQTYWMLRIREVWFE
jgi:hypothetical protein